MASSKLSCSLLSLLLRRENTRTLSIVFDGTVPAHDEIRRVDEQDASSIALSRTAIDVKILFFINFVFDVQR